jgi:hypothetical protein
MLKGSVLQEPGVPYLLNDPLELVHNLQLLETQLAKEKDEVFVNHSNC